MSRIHLRSHTLVLWLSLSAAAFASALSIGCSSSDSAAPGGAGKGGSGGAAATAGSSNGEAGDPGLGGETGEGGREDTPSPGTAGTAGTAGTTSTAGSGGKAAGGSTGGGEAGDPGEGGAGGSPDELDPLVVAAQARALVLINGLSNPRKCTTCHDITYQGNGFFPNITPDVATGIGSWDEEDIKKAIRDGKDKDGVTLCATMERYAFTDDELSDLAIFLKHLPPVSKKISGKCPSL